MKKLFIVSVLLICSVSLLSAQQLPPEEPLMPEEYDPVEFPQWARDLRRFEVISVGSFPITFLFTSLLYDFSLYAMNDFSPEYSMGTQRSRTDLSIIIGAAAGASLLVAAADLIILSVKRNKAEKRTENEQSNVHSQTAGK